MTSCIIVLIAILGVPSAAAIGAIGPRRISSKIRHPLHTARQIGEWGMERYLSIEPLSDSQHFASVCAIPALVGLILWINSLP